MRSYLLGLLGALTAIALAGVLLVGLVAVRGRSAEADRRAEILREIDAYEAWKSANPRPFAGAGPPLEDNYKAAFGRFQVQHATFTRYLAWWIDTVEREEETPWRLQVRLWEPDPNDLRDPTMIDRYLASR